MSRLFISHSSKNDDWAIALRYWLVREGWSRPDDIFLDLDPEQGIAAGQRWAHALEDAATRCEAVLFLVSEEWLASKWCTDEYQLANRLNKKLFALLADDIALDRLPGGLAAQWQIVPLKGEPAERFLTVHPLTQQQSPVHIAQAGLISLKRGLEKAGIGAETFELLPDQNGPFGWRAPYRGLEALEPEDAAVFFGRNADIVRGVDMLRGLAGHKPLRPFVILGASGAGKSSFLRAGLWPRLLRDDSQWLPLRAIRASRGGAIEGSEGLLAALEEVHRRFALPMTRADLRDRLATSEAFVAHMHELRKAAARRALIAEAPYPLPVLCLDQGEELFAGSAPPESQKLLTRARAAIDADAALLLVCIRSDSYGAMQTAKTLAGIDQVPLSLGPVPHGEIAHVIREPAEILRAKAGPIAPVLDAAVVERLQQEIEGEEDSLPLLAFVLQRLMREHQGVPIIGIIELERTGGVAAAIESAAEAALDDAGIGRDRGTQREALRRLFIPRLARIDRDSKAPQRRVARQSEVPAELAPLARALTQRRLLVVKVAVQIEGQAQIGTAADTSTLEVAHEALLRRWPTLADLLAEDRDALLLLDGVLSAAVDWEAAAAARKPDFLAHRASRLSDALALASRGPDWEREIAPARDYLAACEARELRERSHREHLQRRVLYATAAALLVAIIFGGLATLQWYQADRSRVLADLARVEAEKQRTLAEKETKLADDQRNRALLSASRRLEQLADRALIENDAPKAALLALEGLPGPKVDEDRPYLPELESILYQAGTQLRELPPLDFPTYEHDGRFAAVGSDGKPGIYDGASGAILVALSGQTGRVNDLTYSRDIESSGDTVATGADDGTARLWNAATGRRLAVFQTGCPVVKVLILVGRSLFASCANGTAKIWNIADGSLQFTVSGHTRTVDYFNSNGDVHRGISYSEDKTARLWDTRTGQEIAKITVPEITLASGKPDPRRIYAHLSQDGRFAVINRTLGNDQSDAVVVETAHGQEMAHFDGNAYFRGPQDLVLAHRCCKPSHASLWNPDKRQMVFDEDANYSLAGDREVLWSGQSNTAELWNTKTGTQVATLTARARIDMVQFLQRTNLLQETNRIFTGSSDGSVDFWDSQSGRLIAHAADVAHEYARAMLDGRRLLLKTGSTLTLWDTEHGTQLLSLDFKKYSEQVISPDRFVAVVDNHLQIYDATTGMALPKPELNSVDFASDRIHAFSEDGRRGAYVIAPDEIRIWKVGTGRTTTDIRTPTADISLIRFSKDGSKLLLHRRDSIDAWNADSGLHLGRINDMPDNPDFGAHGDLLLLRKDGAAGKPPQTRVWRMDATSPMTSLWLGLPGKVKTVQFMGDESQSRLAVVRSALGPFPFRAQIYDLASGKLVRQITGPTDDFISDGISQDKSRFAAISNDGKARIWDLAKGYVVATRPPIDGIVANDWLLIAQKNWSRLQVWNIATGEMAFELPDLPEKPDYWRFSTDGRYLATVGKGLVRVFETTSGKQLASFPEATGFAFSPNGGTVAVRFPSHRVIIAETATGRTVAEFPDLHSLIFLPHGHSAVLAETHSTSSTVKAITARIVDIDTGQTRVALNFKGGVPKNVGASSDGKRVLVDFEAGAPQLFDATSGDEIPLAAQKAEAPDVDGLSSDGRYVVMTYNNTAILFDTSAKTAVPLHAHSDKIKSAVFTRDGRFVMTVSAQAVWLTNVENGEARNLSAEAGETLRFAVFSPDGSFVVSATETPVLRIWNVETGKLVQSLAFDRNEAPWIDLYSAKGLLLVSVHRRFDRDSNTVQILDQSDARIAAMPLSNEVSALQMNADHSRMVTEAKDMNVSLWDVRQAKQIAQMTGGRGDISFAFSPDGSRIAGVIDSFGRNWSLRLWDGDGRIIASQDFQTSSIREIYCGFSPDSRRLWVALTRFDFPPELHVLDATAGRALANVMLGEKDARLLVSAANNRALVYYYKRGDAQLWDLGSAKQIATLSMIGEDSLATFSQDGSLIATATAEKSVQIWDGSSGALRTTVSGSKQTITATAISRGGRLLAVGSTDGMARVFDIATGKLIQQLAPSMSADPKTRSTYSNVQQIVFGDDGRKLAVRGSDLISVWNLATGTQTAAYPLQESNPVTFSPDGRLLLVNKGYNMPIVVDRVFDRVSDAVAAARLASPRCLTPAERKAAFLDPEPPAWCIEMAKPPYDTAEWQSWFAQKKGGHETPMPSAQ